MEVDRPLQTQRDGWTDRDRLAGLDTDVRGVVHAGFDHQPRVPGAPLKGPFTCEVIHPP